VATRVGAGGSDTASGSGNAGASVDAASSGENNGGSNVAGSAAGGTETSGAGTASTLDGGAAGDGTAPNGAGMGNGGDMNLGASGSSAGGSANGGTVNGGSANGGSANGGSAGTAGGSGGSAAGSGGSGGATAGSGGSGGSAPACTGTEQQPCYSGPADARGKGACKEGKQTCSNGAWGACVGDVQPVAEICDDGVDNDCDDLADDCGNFRCVATFNTQSASDDAAALSVARDSAGNAVLTGVFKGTVDFGGKKLVSNGNQDIFIAKYSPQCQVIWAENFGSAKIDRGQAVAVAANDDIIVAGIGGEFTFTGDTGADIDLGGGSLTHTGPGDAFLARYDQDGKHIWSHLYGGASPAQIADVAIAGNGDVAIAAFGAGANYGGGNLGYGTVAARYTSGGKYIWSTALQYGSQSGINTQPSAVAVDSAGSVLVTGRFDHLTVTSARVAFLTSISADGKKINFAKSAATAGFSPPTDSFNQGYSVVARGTDAVWAGKVTPTINLGGSNLAPLGAAGGWDAFVGAFDASGKHLFSFLDGGPSADGAYDIALDQKGNIGLTGYDYPDGIVVKYSPNGRFLWSKALDTNETKSTAFASDNSLAVAGDFQVTVDLGQGIQTPVGSHDGFLIIYDP
ncbi:MAG TPA: hypothetical protein VNG33_03480, partial [Polyangiaceae bacterium]|nr:hypothetical protein [Polyangiaceae bacterium]